MDIEEIKCEFGDCDWMRVFLNGYTVDAILWLMNRVEELEQVKDLEKEARKGLSNWFGECYDSWWLDNLERLCKGDKTMSVEKCGNQVEARTGQVNQELNNAENAASRVVARIDELEKQLFEVLHTSEPSSPTSSKEAQVEITRVPLAGRIRDHYKLLQDLGTRVEEMRGRLEIR